MTDSTRPYIAVRFPGNHVVFHMLFDAETLGERPADVYDALSQRVQASVREALETLGVHVVETGEEAIGATEADCDHHHPDRPCCDNPARLDPVCVFHGKRASEHDCLYCCLCFDDLTPEECHVRPDGNRENVCAPCALNEKRMANLGC